MSETDLNQAISTPAATTLPATPASHHEMAVACPACGHPHNSEYCSQCGQRRTTRLETRVVLGNAFNAMASLEGPWLRTIKELLLRPSALILAYHAGARHRYVNPVLFVLVSYSFYFLLSHWLGIDPFQGSLQNNKFEQSVLNFITNYSGHLSVLVAYPTALLLRRLWPNTTTAERYVALLYAQSVGAIAAIGVLLVSAATGRYEMTLNYLVSILASLYALAGVHPSRGRSLLIGLAAWVGYFVVLMVTAFVGGLVGGIFMGLAK